MTPYEHMAKYEIGLEMGLLDTEELRRFLHERLREKDIPYMYTSVFLTLDKGKEEVIDTIFYHLQGNYTPDRSKDSVVRLSLIGTIRSKWDLGKISMAECVGYLQKLNDYFDPDFDCVALGENYRLSQTGFYKEKDFNAMLGKILVQGIL